MAAPVQRATKTAAVVYNPIKVQLGALRAATAAAEQRAGWGPTAWFATTVEDPGGGMAKEALAGGADVVIAAGGDGTARAVAEVLRGSGVPIGLLPSGTGNLLARNMSLTLDDLPGSMEVAFTGADRAVDMGVVEAERADGSRETRAFLVMAGLGLDAQMASKTNLELKKRAGWIAYIDPILRGIRDNNSVRVRYSVDGAAQRSATVNTIILGNCGTLPGNLLLLPEAAVDDGVFDIVVFRPKGFIGWVQIWVKITWENGVLRRSSVGRRIASAQKQIRALRYLKGKEFVLRLDHPEEFELDGDSYGEAIALKAHVDPLSLLVRVPRTEG
ncbi:MAG: diacylglycerol kinase [Glaciihabitans sp.]|nr:diacylglycerol kinase [Glaciihabitans sp.]